MMNEQTVQRFWHDHACGDAQVGGLHEGFHDDYEKFFTDYDRFRYQNERHLPACIDALDVAGKQVLEIGLGEGSDSERLIRQGAHWSGADLTAESFARVQAAGWRRTIRPPRRAGARVSLSASSIPQAGRPTPSTL